MIPFSLSVAEQDAYFIAGRAIAMSLVHGGAAPRFLSPLLYEALLFGPERVTVSIDDVPDSTLKESMMKVRSFAYTQPK